MKAIVFDKDGSMYSVSRYIEPFAEQLSRHFDRDEFMRTFHGFRERAVIGNNYDLATLEQSREGSRLRHSIWAPLIVAYHYGFQGDFWGEIDLLSRRTMEDPDFPLDQRLPALLQDPRYQKALVSNDRSADLLKKLGLLDYFDLAYIPAHKDENLPDICDDIESTFCSAPEDIVWVEDDIQIVERLKHRGYVTALRKAEGFNYPPDQELQTVADFVLDDKLDEVYDLLR